MKLVGANAKAVATGLTKQPGIVNYIIGNDPQKWRTRVPTYAKAKLAGVYPGVDVVYYGTEPRAESQEPRAKAEGRSLSARSSPPSALEYDFIIKPGADPRRIRLAFEGADRIRVADGDIILATPAGDVRMQRPYAYQTIGGKRVQVACDYRLLSPLASRPSPAVAFRLAKYDASRPLVVDPVLSFSTLIGGSQYEAVSGGSHGSIIVAGYTKSVTFPVTSGAFDTTHAGNEVEDAYVACLNPTGTALIYATFIGGAFTDLACAVAAAADGSVCVAGYTSSKDYPTTEGAFDRTQSSLWWGNAFVTRLTADGAGLVYSTYLGGTVFECAYSIAVTVDGSAWVTGLTESPGYPVTATAWDTTHNGRYDVFVTHMAPDGSSLIYSTFLGGSRGDEGYGIAMADPGHVVVVGRTASSDFPSTPGAADTTANGDYDAFVARFDTSSGVLEACTYLGGSSGECAYGTCIAANGDILVAGETSGPSFPTTAGAFDSTHNGSTDAFVAKLNPGLSALLFSTFLGGSGAERALAVVAEPDGTSHVVGYTGSPNFPVTPGAFHATYRGGDRDGFLVSLLSDGSALSFATYLGGSGADNACGAYRSSGSDLVVAGDTTSSDFPTSPGAFRTTSADYPCAFVLSVVQQALPTNTHTLDRSGTVGELATLRGYLSRTSDGAKLDGKTIAFGIDGTAVGIAVTGATRVSGRADLDWVISAGPATRPILAEFAGDSAYVGSSDTATLTAQTWQTKMGGVDREGRITAYRILKAWLWKMDNSPVAGKSIAFKLDGTLLGTDNTRPSGLAQIGYTIADGAGAGVRTILAEWAGDGGYLASSCTNTLTVLKATPYIWVMPRSVPVGGVARMYAYFRRLADYQKQEGKTVSFRVDGTWIADIVTGTGADAGIARYPYTTVEPVGAHTIRCEFAGDAWVEAGYGEATLTIY
jgi:hypothetical protein